MTPAARINLRHGVSLVHRGTRYTYCPNPHSASQ
jgi:hypothetical protein